MNNIFILICSCQKNIDKRQACRDSWLKDIPSNITYRFFVGGNNNNNNNEKDVVSLLNCGDYYHQLPQKIQSAMRYALVNFQFDNLFKCDDDTFVKTNRLVDLLTGDFTGYKITANRVFGGAGYMLSKNAVEIIADKGIIEESEEDVFVTRTLLKNNINPIHNSNLHQFFDIFDKSTNWISKHKVPIKLMDNNLLLKEAIQKVPPIIIPMITGSLHLGDKIERIAKPIAKIIDKVVGTNIQNCGGCKKRKDFFNKL